METTIDPDGTVHPGDGDDVVSAFPPGAMSYRLPDGRVIDLTEWVTTSLRSAMIIDPHEACPSEWDMFTYSRGQMISGTARPATHAHANLPRSGELGLPKGWEMCVTGWRATVNMPMHQPILDWTAETSVAFEYASKYYPETTLLDLLLSPHAIDKPPVHMYENLAYAVRVRSSTSAVAALRDWLRRDVTLSDQVRDAITELDAIIELSPENIARGLRRVQAKMSKGKTVTVWVHLDGLMKRMIV